MAHLVNDKGERYAEQYPDAARDNLEVLSWANGSALTSEGLVLFFYPYNLGSGSDERNLCQMLAFSYLCKAMTHQMVFGGRRDSTRECNCNG